MDLHTFKVKDAVDTSILVNLDLPESKRDKLWKDCIDKAKILVGNYKEIRMKVVELALECCVMHVGGKASPERYTMKRFAREIGIKPGTLFEWYRLRQVYLALPKQEQSKITFSQLGQMSRQMNGIKRSDKDFKAKILSKYKEMAKKSESTIKMEKYLAVMKTVHFNVSHERMIRECDQDVLTEILSVTRSIVTALSKQDKKIKFANVP